MTEGTEKNVQNYKRDTINRLAHEIIQDHLINIPPSHVYTRNDVTAAMDEFDELDLWQDVQAEAVSVLDVLLQRYLDDQPIDLTLSRRLEENNNAE